ncbi:BZ3500_MvSof-1268-A1-R1_Chr9g10911 [Microbotryum saponariae]|uniref:BZ3500_MvSof-1268-A1-R1_Chr9g10911 protein n=1 Tax=Microbotryum saponariae TaxID=289078 RepID=A0A2X0LWN9_9BASI|nr:BZ3501_MvSof-1269-A2-R1_Chr9g10659 [Microbotryum saponariae]SDA00905.1 BZ3500_MvSof-1268-A1-R1_Chr9g10911 [Microbotryum saponariae]
MPPRTGSLARSPPTQQLQARLCSTKEASVAVVDRSVHLNRRSSIDVPYRLAVPTRLDASRPRASSRPPAASGLHASVKSSRPTPVTLHDLPENEDEWEPENLEPALTREELRHSIKTWQEELGHRGRPVSGRTIVVVHSLPYVCTLHPTKSHSTSFDAHIIADDKDEPLLASGAQTPLEMRSGDPLLRTRALHSPPTARHKTPPSNFPEPAKSLRPSFHPPCPPSRAPSPDSLHAAALDILEPQQQRHRWVLHPRRGHAALNSGLKSLTDGPLVVVGRPDDLIKADGEALRQAELGETEKKDLERGLRNIGGTSNAAIGCVPVWLDDKVHSDFYEGYCKTELWPIFHYLALPDTLDKKTEDAAWQSYYETNLVYARKVAETYVPGDLIWVHDYHLLLVPQMLRELLPNASPYISLFLHCPFPSSEYFRNLPRRESLLDGMLGCNLICFQTHSYARHFLSSCVRVMGYEAGSGGVDAKGSITRIAHCPIGIDVENVEIDRYGPCCVVESSCQATDCDVNSLAVSSGRHAPGVAPKAEVLRRIYAGKKIIVGRDKLDPTKGVLPKLRAFERFLQTYPEWAHKVVLIQVTSPSPGDSPSLATKVSELVDQINGAHGSLEFQPVHHYHQTIERDEYFALLTVADVALVTSIRDGMNTTSMEYILCQAEAKGQLIVSEFTGVSSQLNKAIKVNPWDLGGVAHAIESCLTMSTAEKKLRHAALHATVSSQTAAVWAHTNILKLLESLQGEQASQNTPPLDVDHLVLRFQSAKKRLLLFDYGKCSAAVRSYTLADGTLTPIVKNPSDAVPSQSLLKSLPILTADPDNVVFIISGRDGDFLEQHLGHIQNLGMSAEHGCFFRAPGAKKWTSLTEHLDMDWKRDVLRIFRYYEARTQGSFVEKKASSVTFHYRNADPVFGLFQAKECQAMLESMQESLPIDVLVPGTIKLQGKKNVEVRPAHTNKGEIVQRLLYQYADTEFCMCAGDDKTDEDMFHSMARIFSTSTPSSGPPLIPAPESLLLFPSLGDQARSSDGELLEPRTSRLDPASMFMIAIEAKESQGARMTMANAVLESPAQMVSLLERLARFSSAP